MTDEDIRALINTTKNAKHAIFTLAAANGIIDEREPIDEFVDAAARLSDADVTFDAAERLLILLRRRGIISDEECFILHAAYLKKKS